MVWVLKKSWFWSQLCSGQKFQKVEKNVRNWRPSGQADWKVERLWKEKLLSSNRLTTFLFRVVQFFNLLGRQFRTRVEIFSLMQALCYEILLHWLKCGKIRTYQTKVFTGSDPSWHRLSGFQSDLHCIHCRTFESFSNVNLQYESAEKDFSF